MTFKKRDIEQLIKFVHERWQIKQRRERGEPKPWTRDPILRDYRFTQVHREDDKVTIWIAEHWRNPHKNDPLLWFAMCVARYFNWPATLERIGYPVPWNGKRIVKLLQVDFTEQRMMARSHKETAHKIERTKRKYKTQIFGGAYFINSLGPKLESVVHDRLDKLWKNREEITKQVLEAVSLVELYEILKAQFGFGTFMAAQVVADLKYTPRFSSRVMDDWHTWAASGPGSRRGLNRLCGRPVNTPWREGEWHAHLLRLRDIVNPRLRELGIPVLHAQDVQGICCCEWDKYQRAKLGEGRPKTRYPGKADIEVISNKSLAKKAGGEV